MFTVQLSSILKTWNELSVFLIKEGVQLRSLLHDLNGSVFMTVLKARICS